jgi:hypothetical protein
MRFDEVRSLILASEPEHWRVLPTEAPTYIHRVQYGSDDRGDGIWGLDEHHSRAILLDDIDVGLVWGMTLDRNLDFTDEWGPNVGSHDAKVGRDLIEVLYRGQPVDRVTYYRVDNFHGSMPIPTYHYPAGSAGSGVVREPDSITVSSWDLAIVSLTDTLGGGGGYGTPESYVKRAGFTID